MTAVSRQNDISADGDATGQDARTGLALLMLLAEAADPHAQDWVNRRVEQLEFLDTRAVRWQVSVDFVVPENAPLVDVGGRKFRLVPLTSWEKSDLVAFNLRDEAGNTLWLPTSEYTTRVLASALTFWASILLPPALRGSPATGGLPGRLQDVLETIVFSEPAGPQKEMNPFAAVDPGGDRDPAILALEENTQFVSRLLPRGPHRKEAQTQRAARQLSRRALTAAQRTLSLAVNATAWVRKAVARTPGSEPDGGGLHIPAADGYHYGDDNPWGPEDLTALVTELRRVELALTGRATPTNSAEDSSTSAEDRR